MNATCQTTQAVQTIASQSCGFELSRDSTLHPNLTVCSSVLFARLVSAPSHLDCHTAQVVLCSFTEGLSSDRGCWEVHMGWTSKEGFHLSGYINPCSRLVFDSWLMTFTSYRHRETENGIRWVKHCVHTDGGQLCQHVLNLTNGHVHSQQATINSSIFPCWNGVKECMSEIFKSNSTFGLLQLSHTLSHFQLPTPPFCLHTAGVAPYMMHIFTQR